MSRIVISYRENDTKSVAGRLHDHLSSRFGEDAVTLGVENLIMIPGDDKSEIEAGMQAAEVLLLLIGAQWAEGDWLRNPDDHDRAALTAARAARCRIIPVLVDDVVIDELPKSMAAFAQRRGMPLREDTFQSDIAKLIETLAETVTPAAQPPPQAAPPPAAEPVYPAGEAGPQISVPPALQEAAQKAIDDFVPAFRSLLKPLPQGVTFNWKSLALIAAGWGIAALLTSLFWLLVAILNFRPGDLGKLYLTIFGTLGGAVVGYATVLILGQIVPALRQVVPPLNQWGFPSANHIAPSLRQRYVQMMVGGWALAFFIGALVVNNVGDPYLLLFRTWSFVGPMAGAAATLYLLHRFMPTAIKKNWLVILAVWAICCLVMILFFAIFDGPINKQLWRGHDNTWSIFVTLAYIVAYAFVGVAGTWLTIRALLEAPPAS